MYFEIEKQAKDAIIKAIDNFDCEIDTDFKLEFPPNPDLGDLASTISFALAKQLDLMSTSLLTIQNSLKCYLIM